MMTKNLSFMEVKILQMAVRQYVKIGEIELATKIFDSIKKMFSQAFK